MPMDCYHIFLDRPWQYDRYPIHNRRLNQYTLCVNGKKKMLLPLVESPDEVNCTTVKICIRRAGYKVVFAKAKAS